MQLYFSATRLALNSRRVTVGRFFGSNTWFLATHGQTAPYRSESVRGRRRVIDELPTNQTELGTLWSPLRTLSMRLLILLGVASLCPCPAVAQPSNQLTGNSQVQLRSENKQSAAKPAWPPQLEMRVPFEPTAFPSGPDIYVMYELHLTNFGTSPVSLNRIEVLDADAGAAQPIATFEAHQLETMLQPLGGKTLSDPRGKLLIGDGQSAIAFMSIVLARGSHVPDRLFHRVRTADSVAEGAVIATHHTVLRVLGPPIEGANWLAADGPSNDQDNHHRRGVVILDGRAVDSRRYAIDWKQIRDGASFSGDARDVRSYYSYGEAVLAVADGRVVAARDGLPDNIPGHGESFHPAVPISLETVAGNTITLDLGRVGPGSFTQSRSQDRT
jgi:hypothetical protein